MFRPVQDSVPGELRRPQGQISRADRCYAGEGVKMNYDEMTNLKLSIEIAKRRGWRGRIAKDETALL